jgi:hypothetical protein
MDRIVMNAAGLARLGERVDVVKGHAAEDVADDARRFCPVDTGELVASIRVRGAEVWVGADHWVHVEYGTRPHAITSHGSWPLRNKETGAVFGRRVWHPGTPAQPFMRPALMRARGLR